MITLIKITVTLAIIAMAAPSLALAATESRTNFPDKIFNQDTSSPRQAISHNQFQPNNLGTTSPTSSKARQAKIADKPSPTRFETLQASVSPNQSSLFQSQSPKNDPSLRLKGGLPIVNYNLEETPEEQYDLSEWYLNGYGQPGGATPSQNSYNQHLQDGIVHHSSNAYEPKIDTQQTAPKSDETDYGVYFDDGQIANGVKTLTAYGK
jgi:hypothetical protein